MLANIEMLSWVITMNDNKLFIIYYGTASGTALSLSRATYLYMQYRCMDVGFWGIPSKLRPSSPTFPFHIPAPIHKYFLHTCEIGKAGSIRPKDWFLLELLVRCCFWCRIVNGLDYKREWSTYVYERVWLVEFIEMVFRENSTLSRWEVLYG